MCIIQTETTKKKSGIGYKVFEIRDGKLASEYYGGFRQERKWLKASGGTSTYGAGWHIFTSFKSAQKWRGGNTYQVVRPVKYRHAFFMGKQSGFNVVVAKEIYI